MNPKLPSTGLFQHMHNPVWPLNPHNIYQLPGVSGNDGGIGRQMSLTLISKVICKLHSSAVNTIFTGACNQIPKMPELDVLRPTKMEFQQFGVIFKNSGLVAGTMHVHNSIFLSQLGLTATKDPDNTTADEFGNQLWLLHGDQLTS